MKHVSKMSNCAIARALNCHASTVARALDPTAALPSKRKRKHPSPRNKALRAKRAKRAKALILTVKRETKSVQRQRSTLTRVVVTMPYGSPARVARQMANEGFTHCSRSTVRRDLIGGGVRPYRRGRTPLLTDEHRADRLKFARSQLRLLQRSPQYITTILFSDEKWFDINDNGARWQWVMKGRHDLVQPRATERHAAKLIMFGAIGIGFKMLVFFKKPERDPNEPPPRRGRPPANAPKRPKTKPLPKYATIKHDNYIAECLVPLKRLAGEHFGRRPWLLMQDNAAPHIDNNTKEWLAENDVKWMEDWPAHSPDMNPIETLWAILARRVSDRGPIEGEGLKQFLTEEWDNMDQAMVDRLVRGYAGQLQACVTAAGGPFPRS
jgi:hypothetical protein